MGFVVAGRTIGFNEFRIHLSVTPAANKVDNKIRIHPSTVLNITGGALYNSNGAPQIWYTPGGADIDIDSMIVDICEYNPSFGIEDVDPQILFEDAKGHQEYFESI